MTMLALSKQEPTRTRGHQQQTECPCPMSQCRPADAGTGAVGAVTSVHPGPPSLGGMAKGDCQGLGPRHPGPEPSSAAADESRGWQGRGTHRGAQLAVQSRRHWASHSRDGEMLRQKFLRGEK